jgi:membrane protease YdiL (CAAX protease family)
MMLTKSNAAGQSGAPLARWALIRLVCYVAGIAAAAFVATILTHALVPPAPSPWHALVMVKNVLLPLALFALYAILVRLMEHRRADEIDIRRGFPALLVGALVGWALMAGFFLILWAAGMAHISKSTGLAGLGSELLVPLVTAMGEELLFRVILFGILEEICGTSISIFLSAALFALSHAGNPGSSPFALAALAFEMGVMPALAYILTRNIWLAVGMHFGWNFAEGFVFGAYDSGLRDPHALFRATLSGADLLTGGSFGPEGSILSLGLCLLASVILIVLIRRKADWQQPRWPSLIAIPR